MGTRASIFTSRIASPARSRSGCSGRWSCFRRACPRCRRTCRKPSRITSCSTSGAATGCTEIARRDRAVRAVVPSRHLVADRAHPAHARAGGRSRRPSELTDSRERYVESLLAVARVSSTGGLRAGLAVSPAAPLKMRVASILQETTMTTSPIVCFAHRQRRGAGLCRNVRRPVVPARGAGPRACRDRRTDPDPARSRAPAARRESRIPAPRHRTEDRGRRRRRPDAQRARRSPGRARAERARRAQEGDAGGCASVALLAVGAQLHRDAGDAAVPDPARGVREGRDRRARSLGRRAGGGSQDLRGQDYEVVADATPDAKHRRAEGETSSSCGRSRRSSSPTRSCTTKRR